MIKENIIFLKEFFSEFRYTGACFLTSKWAASAMVRPIKYRPSTQPLRILELGPGTGSVTERILEQMSEDDELCICEINPHFMAALKRKLRRNKRFQKHKSRISFHQCAAQVMPEGKKFDVIVCAIPFLNFDLGTVMEIFEKLRKLSHHETVMTYYEYMGLRNIGLMMSPPKRKTRIRQIDKFFDDVFENHLKNRHRVWANMLPINVYQLKGLSGLAVAV